MLANGVYTLQNLILLVLAVGALALEAWALIDAVRHSGGAYKAAGKLTKPIWLAILGVATALGVLSLPFGRSGGSPLGLLSVLGVVAAAVYLTDVRPAVRQMRGRGGRGRNSGPYGPW
jgi:4-amino-4-deoxy-L-arabinose transferase-like glycosyltransferase